MAEQQQNLGNPNPFAQRGRDMARANRARRSIGHSPFNESGDAPDPENPFAYRQTSVKTVNTGDVSLRNDSVVAALKEGNAPLKQGGKIVGYENNRLNLLIDQETRKLLDILPYSPSREEALANIIRRECGNMSEEEQFNLACLDTNIDQATIRPMLMKNALRKQSIEQVVQQKEQPEPPSEPVFIEQRTPSPSTTPPMQTVPNSGSGEYRQPANSPAWPAQQTTTPPAAKAAEDFPTNQQGITWTGKDPATDQYSESVAPRQSLSQLLIQGYPPQPSPLTGYPPKPVPLPRPAVQTPAPLILPFENSPAPRVPLMPEKTVMLTCPIGRYKVPVLDVVQKPGYIVIIQREDASLVVAFEANHVTYRLDVVDADLEYSGITYEFNGAVHTVMVMK